MSADLSVRSQLDCSSIAEGVPCGYVRGSHKGATFFMLSNVKVFAKAIFVLSKIGDVLNIEPSENGLALKAFHQGRSAYGAFHFAARFFDEMDISQLSRPYTSCRISMKSALLIFQAVNRGDRSVYGCEITVDPDLDTMLVQLRLASDVTRSYEVPMVDSGAHFRADVDRTSLANRVETNPELLKEVLQQAPNVKELVMSVTRKLLIARTFSPKEEDATKSTMQMEFFPAAFNKFQIKRKTEITFPTKEFAALVSFASDHTLPLNLFFDKPGKTLILYIGGSISYTAEISIATMEGDEDEEDNEEYDDIAEKTIGVYNGEDVGMDEEEEEEEEREGEEEQEDEDEDERSHTREETFQVREDTVDVVDPIDNGGQMMMDNEEIMEDQPTIVEKEDERQEAERSDLWMEESMRPPVHQPQSQSSTQRFRRFFLSSSQQTQDASQLHGGEKVLANESDEEEGDETPFKRRKKRSKR
ncbi:hypothetical protein PFISCL1PPCAC_10534, partial [Pristionchus fissidentatus]